MANTDYISNDTTVFSNVSLAGVIRPGIISLDTRANMAGMTIGQLRVAFQASGISLLYSSGSTCYVLGQSTQSAAQS